MKAVLRTVRISPKKANLVAGIVRGKKVNEALAILKFMPKKGADILYKVVHSAASNAKNNFKQSLDDLQISKILVTKGITYKRSIPISRGRAHPIRKRTSHILVEVASVSGLTPQLNTEEKVAKSSDTPEKKTTKPTAKKTKSTGEVKKKVTKKTSSAKK